MPNSVAESSSAAAVRSPFLLTKLTVFPFAPKQKVLGDVLVQVSDDVRFIRALSSHEHAADFADCHVIVDLQRITNDDDDLSDVPSSHGDHLSESLADSTIAVVAPHPAHDDRALTIHGHVRVREQDQGAEPGCSWLRDAGFGNVLLIAGSREERDVWLLLLRARFAPVNL